MSAIGKILTELFPKNYIPENHNYARDYRFVSADVTLDSMLNRPGYRLSDKPKNMDTQDWDEQRREACRTEYLKNSDRHERIALESEFLNTVHYLETPVMQRWEKTPRPEMLEAARKYLGK